MTTPFDERLDQCLIHLFPQRQYLLSNEAIQAKAAILSLFREMVEEAKPEKISRVESAGDYYERATQIGYAEGNNEALDQYEANLLQQLREEK